MLGIQEASNKNGGCPDDKNKKKPEELQDSEEIGRHWISLLSGKSL